MRMPEDFLSYFEVASSFENALGQRAPEHVSVYIHPQPGHKGK